MQYNLTTDQKKAINDILIGEYNFSDDSAEVLRTFLIEQLTAALEFAKDDRWHSLTWFFTETSAQVAKEIAKRARQ